MYRFTHNACTHACIILKVEKNITKAQSPHKAHYSCCHMANTALLVQPSRRMPVLQKHYSWSLMPGTQIAYKYDRAYTSAPAARLGAPCTPRLCYGFEVLLLSVE